jgi:predicted nuclease of predicted toxin-antitoxin system
MTLAFNLDGNFPDLVCALLQGAGLNAHTVPEEGVAGAADGDVLEACVAEGRVLITLDSTLLIFALTRQECTPGSGCCARQ